MILKSFHVQNFKCLENVKLEGLGQFNVLIGHNNAGKSTVLESFCAFARFAFGLQMLPDGADFTDVLTDLDQSLALSYALEFELAEEERNQYFALLERGGLPAERIPELVRSPYLRQICFDFGSPIGSPSELRIRSALVRGEDGKWAEIVRTAGEPPQLGQVHGISISTMLSGDFYTRFEAGRMQFSSNSGVSINSNLHSQTTSNLLNTDFTWTLGALKRFFEQMFFLSPFRHSLARQNPAYRPTPKPNVEDLPVVLNFLAGKDRNKFEAIENFVHLALPQLGMLHAGQNDSNLIDITFGSSDGRQVLLSELGDGVEQLLMVATVLCTTTSAGPLFLEEPESHLHPGAQRYLAERLSNSGRQVFLTTHSPTFVNPERPRKLFLVRNHGNRSEISFVKEANALGDLMTEIGAKNGDLLLSDAVLFVEGPGDKEIVLNWSSAFGFSLAERNITVIPMGGGKGAERGTPARSAVLIGMSQKSPVPHLFVLDRDERSSAEIENLEKQLGDNLHLFNRREIENYLLIPRAILVALHEKCGNTCSNPDPTERAIEDAISAAINELFPLVLLKRIKSELGGLPDGLLPESRFPSLMASGSSEILHQLIKSEVRDAFERRVDSIDFQGLIEEERQSLETQWEEHQRRIELSPGELVLDQVFQQFGSKFEKRKDAPRIAKAMSIDEIPDEISQLFKKIALLVEKV